MGARKRRHEELEVSEPQNEISTLTKLRNTWEFANLMQYIYIFGKAVKIDEDLDIEDLEQECCKPGSSTVLSDIGLALLKYVSSHRGLTPEIFDEYTRRQYVAKAPSRNPFGIDEEPLKFADFDVFTKLKVLVQLSQWTLNNAERIREKMEERGEQEQSVSWRINEIGYDREDRYYFVLDDNRLYRRTEAASPPPSPPKPKAKSKKARPANRATKRRRTREAEVFAHSDDDEKHDNEEKDIDASKQDDDGFGGRRWECIAITLSEYQDFLQAIAKSRDLDEKALHKRITDDVLPIIEQAEAYHLRKKQKQEREMMNIQKLATAKRSTRIEAKAEKERHEREVYEAEQKRRSDLAEAEAYQKRQQKMDTDRESRMMTREQRLKEREMKRILHEQELARMSEEEKKADAGESRLSERHLKAEMEKTKKELAALQEEDDWTFDCSKCGQHGANWDDGTHSVACERCNVWQHSACLGISKEEAERNDFHFVCHDCKRREEDAKKPKIPSLKFRIGTSSSPPQQQSGIPMITALNDITHVQSKNHPHNMAGIQEQNPSHTTTKGKHRPYPANAPNDTQHARMNGQRQYPPQVINHAMGSTESPTKNANLLPQTGSLAQTNGISQGIKDNIRPPIQVYRPPSSASGGSGSSNRREQIGLKDAAPHSHSNGHSSQKHVGWSASYVPPAHHTPYGPPPPEQNPFAQPPLSYGRQALENGRSQSPNRHFANSAAMTTPPYPPQYYQSFRPSLDRNSSPSSNTTHVNGIASNAKAEIQPIGGPSPSPVKQASPSLSTSPHTRFSASSPLTNQLPLPPHSQLSPGFSPVKIQPSPHQIHSPNLSFGQNPTTLPPMDPSQTPQKPPLSVSNITISGP